jgi:hypothetical protein
MNNVDYLKSLFARFDRLNPPALPVAFLLMTAALLIRMPHLFFTPNLWGEDLTVFIAGALKGPAGAVQPYAGYYSLYSRFVAFGAIAAAPLKYAELLFHLASLAAIYFTCVVTWLCIPTRSFTARVTACLAIVWVPVNTEWVFFTLTNTQWILGFATALLIATNYVPGSRYKPLWCAVLVILCLNGPYAILCLPVVFARMWFYRDVKREKLFYFSILAATAVEGAIMVAFGGARPGRCGDSPCKASTSIDAWYQGIVENTIFQFFGNRVVLMLFGVFLAILFTQLWKRGDRELRFNVLCFLAIAIIMAAAGFYADRHTPETVGPLIYGERYFLAPFLLFICAILASSRGLLRPVAIFFVAFACLAHARPLVPRPSARGADFWKNHVELTRYLPAIRLLAHPFYGPDANFKYDINNPAPEAPPVLQRLGSSVGVEFVGLNATPLAQGGRTVTVDTRAHDAGKNLVTGPATVLRMTVSDIGNGVFEAATTTESDVWFYPIAGLEAGGTLTFSFEARSDTPLAIQPRVEVGGVSESYTATLGPEWQKFVFNRTVAPNKRTRGGVAVVTGAWLLRPWVPGKFLVRNLKATLDPLLDRHIGIPVPDECRAFGSVALTYFASSVAPGFDRVDGVKDKERSSNWNTQYRWIGGDGTRVVAAIPNDGLRWLQLRVNPPMNIRELELRCY